MALCKIKYYKTRTAEFNIGILNSTQKCRERENDLIKILSVFKRVKVSIIKLIHAYALLLSAEFRISDALLTLSGLVLIDTGGELYKKRD